VTLLLFAEKFKNEPQNARLPCEVLRSATVAVSLVGTEYLYQIRLRA